MNGEETSGLHGEPEWSETVVDDVVSDDRADVLGCLGVVERWGRHGTTPHHLSEQLRLLRGPRGRGHPVADQVHYSGWSAYTPRARDFQCLRVGVQHGDWCGDVWRLCTNWPVNGRRCWLALTMQERGGRARNRCVFY